MCLFGVARIPITRAVPVVRPELAILAEARRRHLPHSRHQGGGLGGVQWRPKGSSNLSITGYFPSAPPHSRRPDAKVKGKREKMRPPQHFFPALDFRKPPGRWVLPSLAEGVQGERSVPLAKGTSGGEAGRSVLSYTLTSKGR